MKLISKKQQGGSFEYFVSTLPEYQRDATNFNVKRYWELNGKPRDFEEAKRRKMYTWNEQDKRYHANTVAYNKDTDEYEFMKSWDHPTINYELLWYFNSPESSEFKKTYGLDMDSTPYKYINRKKTNKKLL